MSISRKFQRSKSKYTLSQKIISAVTAAGFIMQPIVGFAQAINKTDAFKDTIINKGNGVTDIWADRVVGNSAVNVFKDFQLDANNIANMYFNTKGSSNPDAANLVNFVNSRIDINGTVNAVKDNKIGGNLFFLSKDGMAVGKSGVINTGSLYVMTPTSTFMESITGSGGTGFNEANFKEQWGDGAGNIAKMQIPVNPSGTISVLGTVNAANDVKMMAAQIGVGKNVSGDTAYDVTKAEAKNALIRTDVVNFTDLVNIKNGENNISAGLNGNLEAQVDAGSGDIVLKAVASTVNSVDKNFDKFEGSDNQALASVTVDGTVKARGDAEITAEATNGVKLEELFKNDSVIEGDDNFTEAFGQITKNVATVDINGTVTGEHVDIQANTVNNYISSTDEDVNLGVLTELAGIITANWDASYAVLANEATVNINEGAVIEAKAAAEEGKNALNISADSSLKASVGASTSAIKLANIKKTESVPAASVGYVKADNSAAVNIAGTLISKGNTNISANADNTVELTSADTTTQLKGQPTVFNVAVAIANGSNSSSVDIKNSAVMNDLDGGLNITATSSNSIDTQALVKGKEGSFLGTAVNITNFDSTANVKIDTGIKADNVNIAAGNSVVKNNVIADNNVGSNYFTNFLVSRATGTKTVTDITNFLGNVKNTLLGEGKPDTVNAINKLGEIASVGVSIGVVNETNNANVTLTKNAQITAGDAGNKGDISIVANNVIHDTSMKVTGASNNYGNDVNNTVIANASVLYADIDSSAAVILEGGDAHDGTDAKYTQLDGAQISVKANSEFKYGRIDKMIGELLLLCNKLENAYASNDTYKQNVENLKALAEEFGKKSAADPDYADSTEGNEAAKALAAAAQQVSLDASDGSVSEQIKDIFVGPFSVAGAAAQFANPGNYANFQAGSSTGGKKDGAKAAVTGSVNLNYIDNNASVIVGKNTQLKGSGKVDINAKAAQADVAFNGKLGFTSGADNAVGGTVGVHYAGVNSMVAVAEGAEITGSAINIGAENDVTHTAITFSAGVGSKNSLSGMASYLEGTSNSIVSIDDEASLTAVGRDQYAENGVDDEDNITGVSDGSVNITAHNNTVLTNIAGGAAISGGNAAIGASAAITDYDVYNMAGIVNNDAGVSTKVDGPAENETEEQKRDRVQKENIAKLQELTKELSGFDEEGKEAEYANLFGSSGTNVAGAGINAHDVNVDVATDGIINTVTIAGSAVTGSDFDKPGIGDKLGNFVSNMENRVENGINKIDTAVQNKYNGTMNSPDLKPTDMQATNPNAGQERPKFTISGAGSSSVNLIDGASTALLDGAKITLTKDNSGNEGKLNVSAADSSFIGAWSGAAAISWKTFMTEQNWNNKSVGFAGAVGVNLTNTDVASIISNSTINNAGSITNTAKKSGALVSAGLGMALEKAGVSGSGGQNYGGAASVSVNDSENDIYALMQNNTVNNNPDSVKTVLTNSAYDNDVQVTGGLNTSLALGGQQGAALGGTVTYADVTNNVQSVISGGTYNNLGTVDVSAVTDITQVGAAVGIAVATGSEKDYGIEGVAAYNKLTNNADAVIDGANITADKVNVEAHDEDLGENKYTDYINKRGLDATGETYLQNISDTAEDLYEKDNDGNIKLDENGQPILKVGQSGNTIVTGALGISASTGEGGNASAAISISDINNDFNASIKNSNIKVNGSGLAEDNAADVNVFAKSDTLLVNIAAGASGTGKGFAGAGSFGWSTINNDNTASIENSTIDAASTRVNAVSGTLGVNVAGQVSVGKQAVGLAVAYNDLENNIGAYILGSDIKNTTTDSNSNEVVEEADVNVSAENNGKIYAVGAGVGVAVSSGAQLAANGTVAINRGNNNIEAIIGDYGNRHTNITNAKNIGVVSNDNSSLLAVAGGVGVSKQVAVGGSVAYNEIGNISGNADGKKQKNTAQINNAVITTADGAKINVGAFDKANLTTAAVGVGVAAGNTGVAVQGAAATALINKDTEASMSGVSITKQNEAGKGADVEVDANSDNNILTTADTASVAVGSTAVAVGAGVAVNRSEAGVKALVSGGTMNVNDLAVNAANNAAIETIGIGGSVAGGTGAGVTGSVAINMIDNDTTAKIDGGADITAENNVVVNAQSDEQIANYAGSASVAAQGAAVGLSVSVNQIDGTTNALIDGTNTKVTAKGNGDDAALNNTVDDSAILDDFVDKDVFEAQESLADKRTENSYSGVAVSASSTHTIKSFLVNAGVAGEGAAVNGTVNVNQTDGSTTAAIKGASVNSAEAFGDVNVIAHDYSNSAGLVGSASVGGIGAGVGLSSDTNTLSRDVTAEISNGSDIYANNVNVEADAKQGVSSLAVGIGAAGIGAGVANGTTVTLVEGNTSAKISGSTITTSGLKVTAKHLDRINTNAISVAGAGGAGIGIGVSVLNENSKTDAIVDDTNVTYSDDKGETVINADNTTHMKYQLYNMGGGIVGVAGSVGVANVNSKVNTNVVGTTFGSEDNKAGSIDIGAVNNIEFEQTAGTAGAGAVGVGVGVSVNTIDSQVQTNVKNSEVYSAGNIDVTAEETRNIEQLAVNAAAGGSITAGANVMITNIGKEVSGTYGTDGMDKVNVDTAYQEAQNAINGGKLTSDYTLGVMDKDEAGNAAGNAVLGKGNSGQSIVKVNIDGAALKADGNIKAQAHETTNVKMDGINAQLSAGGSAAGTVGILNVHRNSGVEITSAELKAAEVDIKAIQSGFSKLNIYQGAGALLGAIGAAYGSINSEGKSGVGIGNSSITSDKDIDISASDESRTEVNAIGVSIAGGGAASIIVAQGTNKAETTVTADKTDMNAAGNIDIHAERQAKDEKGNSVDDKGNKYNSLSVSAIAASGGLAFAGAGVGAMANEYGKVGAEVTGGSNFVAGTDINITAFNAPSVKAVTGAVSGSMVASGAVTVAEANIGGKNDGEHLETTVNISDGNSFTADSLTVNAEVEAQQIVDMNGISVSAALWPNASVQANTGGADIYSDVEVTVGKNVFKGNSDTNGIDLNIDASNSVTQNVTAKGIYASSFIASGTNAAESKAVLKTSATASGSLDGSEVHDLTVDASSNANITTTADGDGGGLIGVSPDAASVDNNYTADTDATISGKWNTTGAVEATAINGGDINLLADALQAAVVGGSGVWLHNTINNKADVNITGAEINSEGKQAYTAQNTADYNGEIKGSGYGGITITGTQLRDNFDYGANVNITNSKLRGTGDEGSITAQAFTAGNINSYNILKSAGVIPVSVADSEHIIKYDNSVNIKGSELITDKKNQDITLSASDNTKVDLNTTADTQGGFAGAASASADNTFDRANKINVDGASKLFSSNDTNLYAGADINGITSSLKLQVLADAYNKTALPLATVPSVENNMTQANQVIIGGDVESVRHINLKAGKGSTTVTESAREYNIYQGTTGSGSVASTTLGDTVGSETTDNFVNITGDVTAGVHNSLNITIDGNINVSGGKVEYDGFKTDAAEDWFDDSAIKLTETPIKNNLKERYDEIGNLIQQYPEGTSEYNSFKQEKDNLLKEMLAMGMAYKDKNGNITPITEIKVPAVEVPDIVVSGGNINIDTDTAKGSGNLTANSAGSVNITNNSDAYLIVNDITMQDAGGQIKFNGSDIANVTGEAGNNLGGNITTGTSSGQVPSINIVGTANNKNGMQADIGIFGDLTNTAGDIVVKNNNYSITVLGNVSGRNISLIAEKGNVTQTSTEGFINIGNDPVTKYQFSEKVAKAIQEYIYDQYVKNEGKYTIPSFNSYDDYLNWIKTNIVPGGYGISESDLTYKIDESKGIVAGGNVYINGLNVNVAGLVQSGYGNYSTTLDADAKTAVEKLDSEWQSSKKPLSDSEVIGNNDYCINGGGAFYNKESKVWDYEVKVYYNPSTGELLTDNVNVNGGKIYITGNISSTGGGRIMAMDGTADINIDTSAVDRNVKVNSITNNDISGLVSITDKQKGIVTEYTNGQSRTYKIGETAGVWQNGSGNYTYNPQEGLQYQWTGGVSGEVIKKYQYSEDFLFWGLLDYGKSDEFVKNLEAAGKKWEETIVSNGGSHGKDSGVIVTTGGKGADFSITGSYTNTGEEKYTAVVPDMKYDGVAGKIFGYGETTYTWSGTQGTASSTTTSIAADKGIEIGFIGNGNKSGNISVTGSKDMSLAGNISNAEVNGAGKGSVTLTSNKGSVNAIGNANINSDDVNITASTGVNVNHASIGDTANINVTTNTGNINFVSGKGNLNIEQMITGGAGNIDATTGSVYLEAQGNILNAAVGEYAVKGQRIDLVSRTGSIGTKDKALTVLGGSELYSSDTMASSVNAQAQGDIVLTQTDGNMRLGTINSENGDAVLTVNNGSFVDAHPSENNDSSSAQDKIDRWLDTGLINSEDGADESGKAAAAAKQERLDGLENQMNALAAGENGNVDTGKVDSYKNAAESFAGSPEMQNAKTEYQKAVSEAKGDENAINAAYEKYKAAQTEYFKDSGFSEAEQSVIANYAEVNSSDNYGWSKNQLLYAIQDSVLNSSAGTVQTVDTPNVTAKNITLNAANGGVGIDGEQKVISYDKLNDVDTLKLLAQAKAGDLTWDEENQQVTVRQQQAITVQVKQEDGGTYGDVNVTGRDNVYLAGVKGTELNVSGVETNGDIRLQGDAGVNVDGTLTGEDLRIAGGSGNIAGNAGGYVDTNIRGSLDANADGNIYISQTGDLNILTIASKQLADIKASGNILMSNVAGSSAQGYINVQNLNLAAGGNIGTDGDAVRILNNGAVVNANAAGDIVLAGVSGTAGSGGELVLGTIDSASLDVTSVGNVSLGKDADDGEEAVKGSINVENNVSISAEGGSVIQAADSNITANKVEASASENILLGSKENKVNSFVVNGLDDNNSLNGSVNIASTAENKVNVEFGKNVGGETVGLTVNGSVDVSSLGEGSSLGISGGSVTTSGENAGSITFNSTGSITAGTEVNSAEDIVITAEDEVTNTGSLTAQNNVNVATTTGSIGLNGDVTGGNNVNVNSGSGAINIGGNVNAKDGFINVTTGSGSITTTGNVSGHKDVTLESDNGDITVGGYTESEVENVTANVKGDGNINFAGEVSANGSVEAQIAGKGDITTKNNADVSGKDINFKTNEGSIITGGDLIADANVNLNTNTGDIIFGGDTTAKDGNVTINIKQDGDLKDADSTDNALSAFSPDGDTGKGNVYINIEGKGDVDLSEIYADNDARVDVADGDLTLGTINGQLVAIQLRSKGKEMNVGQIIAGTQIILTGSDMSLDHIAQRPDADGMLVVTPEGADEDKPIDNFTIGDIKTNKGSGIRFNHLWVKNSNIHISEGQLWFDKLYVEDSAHFSNSEMTAAVYGKPPLRDGSDSVYWINTDKNRPENNLDAWLNGTGDWMYLRFTDDHKQESNGILLTLDNYDYAYNQRFTGENHLRWQLGHYIDEDWKQTYGYGLSLHNRCGLIDYQEFTEANAAADEIAVEA